MFLQFPAYPAVPNLGIIHLLSQQTFMRVSSLICPSGNACLESRFPNKPGLLVLPDSDTAQVQA